MIKSHSSPNRQLFGLLGKFPNGSKVQAAWNRWFHEQGTDAFMGKYPVTPDLLPERLSEMFHFDRRMYFVGPNAGIHVSRLLDHLDKTVGQAGDVDLIVNEGGVLTGHFLGIREMDFLEQKDVCLEYFQT